MATLPLSYRFFRDFAQGGNAKFSVKGIILFSGIPTNGRLSKYTPEVNGITVFIKSFPPES